jgi:hypothetical protein
VNLGAARIVLRARGLSDTFDLGLRWMVVVRRPYFRLSVVLLVPCLLACLLVRFALQWPWLEVWLLAAALGFCVQGAFTVAASRLMFQPDVGVRSVLADFGRRSWTYMVAMVLSRALVALACLVVVLGPFAWAMVAFVPEAVLLEDHGVVAGIRRASAFHRGQGASVLGLLAAMAVALGAFVAGFDQIELALLDFVLQLGRPLGDLWEEGGSAFALVGFFAAIPYLATVRFLHYIDGRTRRDGWDIQLAFLSIALADQAQREDK